MQASGISSKTVPGQGCNSLKERLQGSREEVYRQRGTQRTGRRGKLHSSGDVETRSKCTQLQTASVQEQQGTCTGKVRDKKCHQAEFSLAEA